MKKALLTSLCVAAVTAFAGSAMAGATAGSGIVGSKHDMRLYAGSRGGIVDPQGRVCAYCHTPHHAVDDPNSDYEPLWSRGFTTITTFAPYASVTLDSSISDAMIGPSRLCMSCHDGVVAIDNYYGNPGTATLVEGDAFGEIGVGLHGDMSNDHPIGFIWNEALLTADEINSKTTDAWGTGTTIESVLWNDGANDWFTCATCHDVHNGPSVQDAYFIYGQQQDSAFCTGCHIK